MGLARRAYAADRRWRYILGLRIIHLVAAVMTWKCTCPWPWDPWGELCSGCKAELERDHCAGDNRPRIEGWNISQQFRERFNEEFKSDFAWAY